MRLPILRGRLAVALLASFVAASASAQDSHYWNDHYGPRAMLLSGVMIGSVHDMSATFYNPGALGYIAEPELLLSANVYRNESLTVRDGAGAGVDLESSDFSPLPNMLAGAVRKSWLGNNKLAYSILTRKRFRTDVRGAGTSTEDVLVTEPGDEEFAGALNVRNKLNDLWFGVTWARDAGDSKVGVGVTTYLSVRDQEANSEFFAQALNQTTGAMALVLDIDNFEYRYWSLLWKIGLGFDFSPLTLGVTLTTPNVGLTGSGDALVNATRVGLGADGFATNLQSGVDAEYRSPLSVGAGGAYRLGRARIHASAEWFDSVDRYDVLTLESFTTQAGDSLVTPSLQDESKSVFNWGLGIEYSVRERLDLYGSFTTDFSSATEHSDLAATGYNLHHVAGGGTFGVGRSDITLGLGYAWGQEDIDQGIGIDPGSPADPADRVQLEYTGFTFIFGFSVAI
jgi:hypothetical protein